MNVASPSWRSIGPLSLRYGAGIAFDVFKFAFLVLLGAEAIFLSDVLMSNLLPTVLDHQASFLSLVVLIAFTVPGVMVIALPLSLLVGSYMVIMNRRQATEFVILADMGRSLRALIILIGLIGFGGLVVSHLLSGFIEPLTRYNLSRTLFHIEYDALREGRIASGKFYQIGDNAVFASSGQFSDAARKLFVHQKVDETKNRIIMADQSIRLKEPQISGMGLLLQDVAVYEFETGGIPSAPSPPKPTCVDCADQPDTEELCWVCLVFLCGFQKRICHR